MQSMEQMAGTGGTERKRVEAVVETLATLRCGGESLAEVAHDARNMVTALGLYCDLLEEPGVLTPPFFHYGSELRLVASASRRLVERLLVLDARLAPEAADVRRSGGSSSLPNSLSGSARGPARWSVEEQTSGRKERIRNDLSRGWEPMPPMPIENLARELQAMRNLLAALAGPAVRLTVHNDGGERPVRMSGEDLTRVLVNLVKNASEAMPSGGTISIHLSEQPGTQSPGSGKASSTLLLSVEDNGPGIPEAALERVFESGYTTHGSNSTAGTWPASHRGLGLAITRSIVEAAGGQVRTVARSAGGARFELELPVRSQESI
jgi:signal transduction histidine kinase